MKVARSIRSLAMTVALLTLYVLSAGPLVWLHDRRGVPIPDAVRSIYIPLYLACQNSEIGDATIGRYIRLWESLP